MTQIRTSAFRWLWPLARFFSTQAPLCDPRTTHLDSLPEGLSDHHLRDIGLDPQQIYLYRTFKRDGF